jgi:hypothetical protein
LAVFVEQKQFQHCEESVFQRTKIFFNAFQKRTASLAIEVEADEATEDEESKKEMH